MWNFTIPVSVSLTGDNGKVVKRFFQTSKISLSVTEQMILDEIDKLTPFFKKYYIPYTIQDN